MKSTFTYLAIIIFLLNFVHLIAQNGSRADTLILNGGSMMIGKIIKYNPHSGALIEQKNGYLIKVAADRIERIALHADDPTAEKRKHKSPDIMMGGIAKPYAFRETGVYFTLNGGALFGQTPNGNSELGFGLQATTGYLFHRLLGVGVGTGLDNYSAKSNNSAKIVPIIGELRGYLSATRWSPYYSLQAGYGVPFKDDQRNIKDAKGGVLIHPALGLRLGAREDVNFTIDVGYRFQKATLWRDINQIANETEEQRIWYKRFCLRFGVVF